MLAGYEVWACVRLWNSEIVFGQHFHSSSVELTSIAFWKYQVVELVCKVVGSQSRRNIEPDRPGLAFIAAVNVKILRVLPGSSPVFASAIYHFPPASDNEHIYAAGNSPVFFHADVHTAMLLCKSFPTLLNNEFPTVAWEREFVGEAATCLVGCDGGTMGEGVPRLVDDGVVDEYGCCPVLREGPLSSCGDGNHDSPLSQRPSS
ncbi:hypothetical protein BT96DRAFT_946283 [Gymnopus androsaceus JB14]|uniref:Uncharacterized protein n=1 Tax=Gymnopus androsaceus JB14 TaxID=1447944 RepID=A0A6A4GYS7_9AGAR|nr:hypothetical protein BT96DRAFT_946283 [Gymnopus androsaceus JB14]